MSIMTKREEKKKYEKRKHAKSDKALKDQIPEICINCGSSDTKLIYHYHNKNISDYGDDAGWSYEDRVREYKYKNCGIYFEIVFSDIHREYYTR